MVPHYFQEHVALLGLVFLGHSGPNHVVKRVSPTPAPFHIFYFLFIILSIRSAVYIACMTIS